MARLSKRFYDQFGEETTKELVDLLNVADQTYRTELREQNEMNFARFDATLRQGFAEQDAKWERRFAQQDTKWERRFAEQDTKMEQRFAQQDTKWEQRLAQQETRLVRWMLAFWTGSTLTLSGLMVALSRLR